VDLKKDAFKKMFPKIAEEMNSDENRVPVNSVRTDQETGERHVTGGRFVNYVPEVIDFIRRCDTNKQAEEIISYMEKRGEIETQYASKLRRQLRERGVRSFGSKKEHDYYLKHGDV
jgi:hypothetical protein